MELKGDMGEGVVSIGCISIPRTSANGSDPGVTLALDSALVLRFDRGLWWCILGKLLLVRLLLTILALAFCTWLALTGGGGGAALLNVLSRSVCNPGFCRPTVAYRLTYERVKNSRSIL